MGMRGDLGGSADVPSAVLSFILWLNRAGQWLSHIPGIPVGDESGISDWPVLPCR